MATEGLELACYLNLYAGDGSCTVLSVADVLKRMNDAGRTEIANRWSLVSYEHSSGWHRSYTSDESLGVVRQSSD